MVRPCVTTTTASQPVSEEGSWLTRSTADSHHVRTRSYTSAPLSPPGKRYQKRPKLFLSCMLRVIRS